MRKLFPTFGVTEIGIDSWLTIEVAIVLKPEPESTPSTIGNPPEMELKMHLPFMGLPSFPVFGNVQSAVGMPKN